MLSRLRAIKARRSIPPKLTAVNYTAEHVRVAKTLERRKRIADAIWARLGIVRYAHAFLLPGHVARLADGVELY